MISELKSGRGIGATQWLPVIILGDRAVAQWQKGEVWNMFHAEKYPERRVIKYTEVAENWLSFLSFRQI